MVPTIFVTNAQATLTPQQRAALTYPEGYTVTETFIYQQLNRKFANTNEVLIASLILFMTKDDNLYAYYFDVSQQQDFSIKFLKETCEPVTLINTTMITEINYLETYIDVNGTTTSLILNSADPQKCNKM